ncbi:hypothetical protein C2S52_015546 [Perilla frutescens var. hirtella]|nr:hypothetical protein C2S52_015546 [Perilla frutescens var. hirtella]
MKEWVVKSFGAGGSSKVVVNSVEVSVTNAFSVLSEGENAFDELLRVIVHVCDFKEKMTKESIVEQLIDNDSSDDPALSEAIDEIDIARCENLDNNQGLELNESATFLEQRQVVVDTDYIEEILPGELQHEERVKQ